MQNSKCQSSAQIQEDILAPTFGFQIALIAKLKRKLIDTYVANLELSRTEWQALFWINRLGDCGQKELLKNLEIDAGHLARVLEKLEKKNYITRMPIPTNRRCVFIHLTEYSKKNIIPKILLAMKKEDQVIFEQISDEDKIYLQQLLLKIENNLEVALITNLKQLELGGHYKKDVEHE